MSITRQYGFVGDSVMIIFVAPGTIAASSAPKSPGSTIVEVIPNRESAPSTNWRVRR